MPRRNALTPQEELFCSYYCCIGSDTYCNAYQSAIEAGYKKSSARRNAYKLLRRPEIQKRIVELNASNMEANSVTVEKVLSDLEGTRIAALHKEDYSTATRCSELQGKYLAMFTERFAISADERTRLENVSDDKKKQIQQIGVILMRQHLCALSPQIDAEGQANAELMPQSSLDITKSLRQLALCSPVEDEEAAVPIEEGQENRG